MKITEAIGRADDLSPNCFDFSHKLDWCGELNSRIRLEVLKKYAEKTYAWAGEMLPLPDGVLFEDIRELYLNGRALEKAHFLLAGAGADEGFIKIRARGYGEVRIIYLTRPGPIRSEACEGAFPHASAEGGKFLSMAMPPFRVGDIIEYKSGGEWPPAIKNTFSVLEARPEGLLIEHEGELPEELELRRVITEETEAPPPYDEMFIYWLLSKTAYFGGDYSAANAHIAQFGAVFADFERWHKANAPRAPRGRMKGFWGCGL